MSTTVVCACTHLTTFALSFDFDRDVVKTLTDSKFHHFDDLDVLKDMSLYQARLIIMAAIMAIILLFLVIWGYGQDRKSKIYEHSMINRKIKLGFTLKERLHTEALADEDSFEVQNTNNAIHRSKHRSSDRRHSTPNKKGVRSRRQQKKLQFTCTKTGKLFTHTFKVRPLPLYHIIYNSHSRLTDSSQSLQYTTPRLPAHLGSWFTSASFTVLLWPALCSLEL